jgi:hypothetical protein
MLISSLFSMAGSLGKSYLQFLTMHISIFPTYFAPWDDLSFIQHQDAQKVGILNKLIKTLTTSSSTTPPIFSKIFVYNGYNNCFPLAKIPGFFKINMAGLSNKLIESEIKYYQATNIYDDLFYFYPINGFFLKTLNNLLILLPYREIYGLFHKFSFYLNQFLIKRGLIKKRIWRISIVDYAYLYFHKRQIQRNLYYFGQQGEPLQFKSLSSYLNREKSTINNYIAQFLVEVKNLIVNAASSEIVKKAGEFINKFIPNNKNARNFMFKSVKKSNSLRRFHFSGQNTKNFINYFSSIIHANNKYQILEESKKNIVNGEKKQQLKDHKKKIHMPHLFLIGNDSEMLSVKIVKIINSLLKIYPAYFDCYALKNSLRHLSTSPKASTANFVTVLFKLLQQNQQLKKLFSDTRTKKYRLDILIFNDVLNLIKNRFNGKRMSISDLLATTMFLENIYHGYTFSYIFTVEEMKKNEIDFSIFKSFQYIIYLENNYEKKSQYIELKILMTHIYNHKLIKNNKLNIKDLTRWSWQLLSSQKNLSVDHLEVFFSQLNMILEQQELDLNYEFLNIAAKMFKLI